MFNKFCGEEIRGIMFGIGTTELVVVLFIVLLLFGGKKLPELARSMGSAVREYTKASTTDTAEVTAQTKEEEDKSAIIEAAKKMGIAVEGRSIKEIAQDLVEASEKE